MILSPYAELKRSALIFVTQKQSEQLTSMEANPSQPELFQFALISYLIVPLCENDRETSRFTREIHRLFRAQISQGSELDIIMLLFAASYELGECSDEDLTALTLLLIRLESKPGGPYTTNLTEIKVLSNVLVHTALQLLGIYLPNLENYLVSSLEENNPTNAVINSPWLHLYLTKESLPRSEASIIKIAESLMQNKAPESSLDKACQILIFQDFRKEILAPFQNQKFSGDEAVSAALWVKIWHEASKVNEPNPEDTVRSLAIGLVSKKINSLGSDLRESSLIGFTKLLTRSISHEIINFSSDLSEALGKDLPSQLFARLGAANIFHWLALEIYENQLSWSEPSDLNLANIYLRTATKYYEECAGSLEVDSSIVALILDAADEAHAEVLTLNANLKNSLEHSSRWLPTMSRHIAERSFGHCLGPVLIIESLVSDKSVRQNIKKLLHHYTTVRQICNDLHNWPTDFSQKRVTSVTKSLFLTSQAFQNINQFQAKKIFWHEGLDLVIKHAKQELDEAKYLLKKIKWPIHSPALLSNSIAQLELALNMALKERTTIKSLIHQFN